MLKVDYPDTKAFGETVHWLDVAYAEDTASWSKHANICLTSHKMNLLILVLDTKSALKSQRYASTIETFRQSIDQIVKEHNLRVVPVIYPAKKQGSFSDENQRLEHTINLDLERIPLPMIGLIHGPTQHHIVFPH